MNTKLPKAVLFSILLLCIYQEVYCQLVNHDSEITYKKVFVESDDFNDSYLTVLEATYPKMQVDSLKYSMLNDLAYYWHTRNLKTAMKFTKRGLALTAENKDTLWHGRFQITQGSILLRQEKLDSAQIVLNEALPKVKKGDTPFLYTQLGYVFERRGELDQAADYAQLSLELGKELHDLKAQAMGYSDLSNLFWKQSKFEKGLELGLKSIQLFEERAIQDLDYDFTLYVVGNNYLELEQYDKALNYYKKSIKIGERYGFYNNLSDVYISLTDLYTYLKDFEQANQSGFNAVKYAELLDNNFMLMRSWLSIGKMQHEKGDYTKAIGSLEKCISIATTDFGDEFFLGKAYEALAEAYSKNEDYREAFHAQQRFTKLKDSIFTAEADQRISLLQTEYDVALKEDTIKLQEARIAQQKARQVLVIVVACSLLVLLGVLFTAFQNNKKKNRLLKRQNDEKEFLLKEIHHRVKNNLEIVSSLLFLQSAQLKDDAAIDVMKESQNRVQSMSMIHQRLYQGENLASIEMKDYFINLGNHVLDSFGVQKRIDLKCAMENLNLDVDTAVPLGLIVNELLTNAMKYAFPSNRKGEIKIKLVKPDAETLKLEVTDNGIGLKQNVLKGTGFGTQLISLLVQQLNGELSHSLGKGTKIAIQFKLYRAA